MSFAADAFSEEVYDRAGTRATTLVPAEIAITGCFVFSFSSLFSRLIVYFITFMSIRMAMTSEIQSQLSKRNAVTIGGNLAVNGEEGGGAATAVFRHHLSEVSSVEVVASAGLRALIGVQTTRWVICIL